MGDQQTCWGEQTKKRRNFVLCDFFKLSLWLTTTIIQKGFQLHAIIDWQPLYQQNLDTADENSDKSEIDLDF